MRIVIDMQGAQSASRTRGIGRYTLSFVEALIRNRGEHEIVLALNGLLADTIEPIRLMFRDLLPQENIRVWYAPGPVSFHLDENDARRQRAQLIREAFLTSLNPDVVHVTSLFEGFFDNVVTSVSSEFGKIPVSVTLYDLIPLLDENQFLTKAPRLSEWYYSKLEYLKTSSKLLSISNSSCDDAKRILDIPTDRLVNVGCSYSNVFETREITDTDVSRIALKFGLPKKFIVCAATTEHHKNVKGFLYSFSLVRREIRDLYSIVFVGSINRYQTDVLMEYASNFNIPRDKTIVLGYVSDEDLVLLYNLCDLTVVPSYLEGFGLPALEAMACGSAVIGSNIPSISEIIGLQDALFNPRDSADLTKKLSRALSDSDFQAALKSNGLRRATQFSWDATARSALSALESMPGSTESKPKTRKESLAKLAFVSPLPPSQTGIAEYSSELIEALSLLYELCCIVENPEDVKLEGVTTKDPKWFEQNYQKFDRVIYHVGNSPFHDYIRNLLESIPGITVLHDFFLGEYLRYWQNYSLENVWFKALYNSHGYTSLKKGLLDPARAVAEYPANLDLLQNALGVIVHSKHSKQLAERWYGSGFADNWEIVPMLRQAPSMFDRERARAILGIDEEAFVVCSFGLLAPTKLNHRLLRAFLDSELARDNACQLVFVGQHGGEYGAALEHTIATSEVGNRVRITGWADMPTYRNYLAAADVAVQLRSQSRGETSAATLDCMNYGLATVVNAHGSLAELPDAAVWKLPDDFHDESLTGALENLWMDANMRRSLGERGRDMIRVHHSPAKCAQSYKDAIEHFHAKPSFVTQKLVDEIAVRQPPRGDDEYVHLATAISLTLPRKQPQKCIYLDISETCRTELRSGIERVAISLLLALLEAPPEGWRIEPVYLDVVSGRWVYRHASDFTLKIMGFSQSPIGDDIVEPQAGDILLGLDFSGQRLIDAEASGLHADYRKLGVSVRFVVFDILPLIMPEFFPPEADAAFREWLLAVIQQDGVVCISKAVSDDLSAWVQRESINLEPGTGIGWFHLGADIDETALSRGLPESAAETLSELRSRPTFLMVSTVEPRKGHLQVLDAFQKLWSEGLDANLVVVGVEGWKPVAHEHRRSIPEIVQRLRDSAALDQRLYWLEGVSDEYLENIYQASDCLIAASEGEGFGLPLIEAARHKLPILARDIPVFHEVAGRHAFYFRGSRPEDLVIAVNKWLALYKGGEHPISDNMPWLTWRESASMLIGQIMEKRVKNRETRTEVPAEEQSSTAA